MLRASPAQRFEIVVASENATETMELLARRGQIQFEWTGEPSATTRLERLHGPLKHYRALAAELSGYWPSPVFERRSCMRPVEVAAEAAIQPLERWVGAFALAHSALEPANRSRRRHRDRRGERLRARDREPADRPPRGAGGQCPEPPG